MKNLQQRKEEFESKEEYKLTMTQNMMKQLKSDIQNIPIELIELPENAYRPDNLNLEVVGVLEKHSLNMMLDPKYIETLKKKEREKEEETEDVILPSVQSLNTKRASESLNIDCDESFQSEVIKIDTEEIEKELQRLKYINENMKDEEKLKDINLAHLDKIIQDFDFIEAEGPEVQSQ